VRDYLFNNPRPHDTDVLARFKLVPTPSDRDIFHDIVRRGYGTIRDRYNRLYRGGHVPKNTPVRALRAYEEFYRLIDRFAQSGSAELREQDEGEGENPTIGDETDTNAAIQNRLKALLAALLNRMKLVVITLGEDDDAQVIFETLNSRGEPLLAMDLVRNNIFHRAEKEGGEVEDLYDEFWGAFDNPWWKDPAPFASPKRPRIDHFLAHVLVAETGQRISMRELYAEYRAFAVPKGRPRFDRVEDELKLLRKYSPIYQTLEGHRDGNKDLHWLGRKLAAWQVTSAYPVAMQINTAGIEAGEKRKLYRLIYAYIVRRALSALTPKNLNQVFQSLAQAFIRNGPSVATFEGYFGQRTGDSSRFPTDREFRQAICSQPAYTLAPQMRIKDVLWELEVASRSRFAEQLARPEGLWIEHVLPQTWTEAWPFEDGEFVDRWSGDPKAVERNMVLHTLGNLTLLSSALDISISNKPFHEKRERMEEHSSLFLNRWFLEKESWNERDIRERSNALADKAIAIWPALNEPETEPEDVEGE